MATMPRGIHVRINLGTSRAVSHFAGAHATPKQRASKEMS
jgi:hypothetical protein